MKGCFEAQAVIRGECDYRSITGCIHASPLRCGSMIQVHIHGLPCGTACFGFCIELCGRRISMPSLINSGGEALLSVYTDAFSPEDALGAKAIITLDPCSPCACPLASGCFQRSIRPDCCPPDPRPLFAALIRR